ncbi:hypothetical protein [Devosia sp. SL43]|uniref:hypothetical protein n=1 Tax=Devosia sp. SL43 TaxID=2806348 RepID=UPI001F1A1E82|nr:hypothetical protein [Devosia sp. SL43]UJW86076.1 hypothetical protein IM737_01975 [Devosia sp. SL43]
MALDRSKLTVKDYVVGAVIVAVCFIVVFFLAAWLVPAAPQWILSAIAAVIGVVIWTRVVGRNT